MKTFMTRYLRPAVTITLILTVLTGLIYPGVVTALAQLIFPYQANGSLHKAADGTIIGSDLIGQQWTLPKYFHGRPSATLSPSGTPQPYSADNSGATNLGPTNSQLVGGNGHEVTIAKGSPVPANATPVAGKQDTYYVPGTYLGVQNYADQFRKENGLASDASVPVDMVTASASGLDPDISVEGAQLQVKRIANVRGLSLDAVLQIVNDHIQGRFLWIFGEPHVNVLELNLALDGIK